MDRGRSFTTSGGTGILYHDAAGCWLQVLVLTVGAVLVGLRHEANDNGRARNSLGHRIVNLPGEVLSPRAATCEARQHDD